MKNITLSKPEIQTYFGKYIDFSRKAAASTDSESDLKAAFYAPILLLQESRSFHRFEETMDKVLFHLDCAYSKAIDQDTKTRVTISTQTLLEFHITLIELKLRESKQNIFWDFLTTLLTSLTGIIAKIKRQETDLTEDISKLFSACVAFFVRTRMTKDDEKSFYEQLLKIYKKVLNSPVYSKQYNLVKNSFIRVDSKRLLLISLRDNNFASTVDMIQKFGFNPDETGKFLRLIFDELQSNTKYQIDIAPEDIISTRIKIKSKNLPNRHELDEVIFTLFKTKVVPRVLSRQGLTKSLLYIKEFGVDDHELKSLLISLIDSTTTQTEISDFVDIMTFSKENDMPVAVIKENILKVYEQNFKPPMVNTTKYIIGVMFIAPLLCLALVIRLWESEPNNGGWSTISGFFSSLLHASIEAVPYVLGILLLVFGLIALAGFVINSLALQKNKKKAMELDNLLSAKIRG